MFVTSRNWGRARLDIIAGVYADSGEEEEEKSDALVTRNFREQVLTPN